MTEIFCFLDTETTGFKKQGNMVQEGQGRVCQLAMIIATDTKKIIGQFGTLIKPDGWKIGEGAFKVHGITDEECEKYGISSCAAFNIYARLVKQANKIVAHNKGFDSGMMYVEQAYYNEKREQGQFVSVDNDWHCTMEPNAGIEGGKSLANCLKHYCGRENSKAHNAMADAKACMDIFFAMREKEAQAA